MIYSVFVYSLIKEFSSVTINIRKNVCEEVHGQIGGGI